MALDNPEDEVSPLWQMALANGKYRECPYLQGNRQGQCPHFRRYGPTRCRICGYQDGLKDGHEFGYQEGRTDEADQAELKAQVAEEERYAGMD